MSSYLTGGEDIGSMKNSQSNSSYFYVISSDGLFFTTNIFKPSKPPKNVISISLHHPS